MKEKYKSSDQPETTPEATPQLPALPPLAFELQKAGLKFEYDYGTHTLGLNVNQQPKVLGKDGQLIFSFTEAGELASLRVL